ncbi:hypothetical protein SK128_013844, partial [Halocaridina rubra]
MNSSNGTGENRVEPWEVMGYSVMVPVICGIVLSAADLITVLLVFLSGLARGVWVKSFFWRCFDELFHIPVGSIAHRPSLGELAWFCVHFQSSSTSRYAFTFTIMNGKLVYSEFAKSKYYAIHNWFRLVLLGLIPSVTLLLGNLLLMHSLWRPRGPLLPARSLSTAAV